MPPDAPLIALLLAAIAVLAFVIRRNYRRDHDDEMWGRLEQYSSNILYALDLLGSALTGGDARETISSRAGKAAAQGRLGGRLLCRFLHLLDPDHCRRSIHDELGGRALWRVSWRAWALAGLWMGVIIVALNAYC